MSYHRELSGQVSQILIPAHLTVLRLITTVWAESSNNSYLRDFSSQLSQIVFWAHLTVLGLITTFMSKNFKNLIIYVSSVHKYHKSCSEPIWPFYGLFTTVWAITSKMSYVREFQSTSIKNRVLCPLDRFTSCKNCMSKNFQNLISPGVECTSITNRVSSSFDRFTGYYNCMN